MTSRNPVVVNINKFGNGANEQVNFDFLGNIEFNSKRKRASVILKQGDKIILMCKGADNVMIPLLQGIENVNELNDDLRVMGEAGLRTLIFGHAEMPLTWWEDYKKVLF